MPPMVVDLPTLRSARLILTPLADRHVRQFASIAAKHAIADTTISVPYPLTEDLAREWIAKTVSESRSGRAAHYCIGIGPAPDEMIGYAGLKAIDQNHGEGEISFWLDPDEWGQGYMTEAGDCLLEFGFDVLQLNRICAYHMVRNPASARVLARLGFRQEGRLRERVRKWGVYEDVLVWSRLASDRRSAFNP
jgi:[ribosomal protein S5]-alanine N-acetyltransferase